MADVDQILRRHKQLRTKRTLLDETYRRCYDVTYPLRGARFATAGSEASQQDEAQMIAYAKAALLKIFDSTATDSVRTLASALVAGLVPSNSRWVEYGVAGMEDEALPDEDRVWLDESADIVWRNVLASNFDAVIFECMIDECIAGLFALYVDEDDEGGYKFEQWALAGCYCAQSKAGGPLDIWHRELTMTAEQAINEYGPNMVSKKTRDLAAQNPDAPVTVIQAIYPRKDGNGQLAQNMPFAACHVEKDAHTLLRERGYHELPIIGPRWTLLPGSVYPTGPVFEAMPDILTLNKVVEMSLANLDLAVAGMWGAVDDGVMNPNTVRVGPRKIIVMADKDSFFPLQPAGKFDVTAVAVDRLDNKIRRVLMSDQLEASPDRPQMTLGEFQGRVELLRQLLGPNYGRMQSELLQPLGLRLFGLAYRAGALGPAPESLRGKELVVRYKNPMARAQKMADVGAMDRYETTLGQESALRPEVLDNYEWDDAVRKRAELLGVPARLIPEKKKVAQDRKDRADQQKQQQTEAVAMQAAAGAMPKMGATT